MKQIALIIVALFALASLGTQAAAVSASACMMQDMAMDMDRDSDHGDCCTPDCMAACHAAATRLGAIGVGPVWSAVDGAFDAPNSSLHPFAPELIDPPPRIASV